MFNVILYKFNKKPNSTKLPPAGTASRTFSCYALDNSSIIRPTLVLQYGTSDIIAFNYAYIPSWGRYYFINDIAVLEGGIYQLQLSGDVLASFRSDILNSSQYVLRSASDHDRTLIDNKYPSKATSSKSNVYGGGVVINAGSPVSGYFDGILLTGCYVVQVFSDNVQGVTTYAMNQPAFRSLLSNLLNYLPSDISDVSAGIGKALFDPLQYIISVMWFPNFPDKDAGQSVSSINFGGYSIGVSGTCKIFDSSIWDNLYCDITVPKHPDAATYPYMQLTPFSQYDLYFEPFGSISLDTTRLYGVNTIRCRWYLEYQKGMAHLQIEDAANSRNIIASADAQFGINIPISQITVDYFGFASSVLGGGISATIKGVTGDIIGAIGTGLEAIGSGMYALAPRMYGKGTPDSFLIFRGESPRIEYQFFDIVERDNTRQGEPLCKVKTLSDLSGFTLCLNAAIEADGLQEESDMIASLLNTGVYIE